MVDDPKAGVNWRLMPKIFLGWIFTLVLVGLATAGLYAQGVYAPSAYGVRDVNSLENALEAMSEQNVQGIIANEDSLKAKGVQNSLFESARKQAGSTLYARQTSAIPVSFYETNIINPTTQQVQALIDTILKI